MSIRVEPFSSARAAAAALSCCLLLALSCASSPPSGSQSRYDFFGEVQPDEDRWFAKVEDWQERARNGDRAEIPSGDESLSQFKAERSGRLGPKMGAFATEERRDLARRINSWSQHEARRHYLLDESRAPIDDHWPTFKQLLDRNGDDCDGLDLITYELLRSFGFPEDQVYRAIVRRDRDGRLHMVTLWFENPLDPWVLDATTAMTASMRRFSELPGWTPTKMFNERRQYGVFEKKKSFASASE